MTVWKDEVNPLGPPADPEDNTPLLAANLNALEAKGLLNGSGPPDNADGVDGNFYIDTSGEALYGPKAADTWPPTPIELGGVGPGGGGGNTLSGTGAPSNALGLDGDFYVQTDSDPPVIYGPKADGDWGDPITIGGGAMLSGAGAPSEGIGSVGDFYIDTAINLLYGPKTETWGDPIDLGASTTGGPAGGVLAGIYPNPGFAQDMATEEELDGVRDDLNSIDGFPVLAGTVEPISSDGILGSWFLDTASAKLYGPKGAGGWNTANPILLNGIPIIAGGLDPENDVGANGDYFLNTITLDFFGPKDPDDGWPAAVPLKGDKGDPGGEFTWRGAWLGVTAYDEFDAVSRDGSSWVAATSTTGDDPSDDDGSNWTVLAEKGDRGIAGPPSGSAGGLLLPVGHLAPLVLTTGSAQGTNTGRFARMASIPATGTLTQMAIFVGTGSGSAKFLIYDTGEETTGSYTRLYVSAPVSVATSNSWVSVSDIGLAVEAGQDLMLGVVVDNSTVTFGRGNIAAATAASTLPAGFMTASGGNLPKTNGQYSVQYASPVISFAEASMTPQAPIPMMLGQFTTT